MSVVYTDDALAELESMIDFIKSNYPTILEAFRRRLEKVLSQIDQFPESAVLMEEEIDVHVAPLVRYPYIVFYRHRRNTVEILHIRHVTRDYPPDLISG